MDKVVGVSLLTAYVAARLGVFGNNVVRVYKDDEWAPANPGILWNTAYWQPADIYVRVYTCSIRPIVFEEQDGYGKPFYFEPQQQGQKS